MDVPAAPSAPQQTRRSPPGHGGNAAAPTRRSRPPSESGFPTCCQIVASGTEISGKHVQVRADGFRLSRRLLDDQRVAPNVFVVTGVVEGTHRKMDLYWDSMGPNGRTTVQGERHVAQVIQNADWRNMSAPDPSHVRSAMRHTLEMRRALVAKTPMIIR